MAHHTIARSLWLLAPIAAAAQTTTTTTSLDTVVVTSRTSPVATIGGFGDVPLAKAPFQASVISAEQLRDRGANRLADLTRIDPAVSDSYNTEGYWDYLTVRGFVIDNRFNYRRDGLPINAETSIGLDNKERVEILKGTSGLQAGTSAPGGLVNLVVKRPAALPVRSALLGWRDKGTIQGAVDLGQRFGPDQAFGVRLNVAAERLRPHFRDANGNRHLLALAAEWQATPDTLVEAEFETSHKSQPSVPGFSLLGDRVPAPGNPRINLNNQPWSQPVVLDGDTASLRLTQKIGANWRVTAHGATQRLTSQDRAAFPFGCSAENDYTRYCRDGSFDLYDFRSENEHRRQDALELAAHGAFETAGAGHAFNAGVLLSRVRNRFQGQAYNYVGSGNVDGTAVTPADPSLTPQNTDRDERSTEWFVRDALRLSDRWTAWLGARHTRLHRDSVRTDGSSATAYGQSITTPWAAAGFAVDADTLAYASWGRGSESEVVPNRAGYVNTGEALPTLKSRQVEVGIKVDDRQALGWGIALFDIERPAFGDVPASNGAGVERRVDGRARHLGAEAEVAWRAGPWLWQGGVQWLHARRDGSFDAAVNGRRPVNVPTATLKLAGRYDVAALPGLSLAGNWLAESDRAVLPGDANLRIPGYGRVDAQLRYAVRGDGVGAGFGGVGWVWRLGVDNVFDRRAWRESPLQFQHVYLFPLAPRSWRLSVEVAL